MSFSYWIWKLDIDVRLIIAQLQQTLSSFFAGTTCASSGRRAGDYQNQYNSHAQVEPNKRVSLQVQQTPCAVLVQIGSPISLEG